MHLFIKISCAIASVLTLILAIYAFRVSYIYFPELRSLIILFTIIMSAIPFIGIITSKKKDYGSMLDVYEKVGLILSILIIYSSIAGLFYNYYMLPPIGWGIIEMPLSSLIMWLLIFTSSLFITISLFKIGARKKQTKKKKVQKNSKSKNNTISILTKKIPETLKIGIFFLLFIGVIFDAIIFFDITGALGLTTPKFEIAWAIESSDPKYNIDNAKYDIPKNRYYNILLPKTCLNEKRDDILKDLTYGYYYTERANRITSESNFNSVTNDLVSLRLRYKTDRVIDCSGYRASLKYKISSSATEYFGGYKAGYHVLPTNLINNRKELKKLKDIKVLLMGAYRYYPREDKWTSGSRELNEPPIFRAPFVFASVVTNNMNTSFTIDLEPYFKADKVVAMEEKKPDLTIYDVMLEPEKPVQNETVNISILIKNNSDVPINKDFEIKTDLLDWFTQESFVSLREPINQDSPLQAKEILIKVYTGKFRKAERINASFDIDINNDIAESDESNNHLSKIIDIGISATTTPTTPTTDKIKIHAAKIEGDNLVVNYSKTTEGCAKLTAIEYQGVDVNIELCKKGEYIEEKIPLCNFISKKEININLCDKESNECSSDKPLKVTNKVDPPEIHSLKIDGDNLKITYSKEFSTCTSFLTNDNKETLKDTSLVCKAGKNLEAIVPLDKIEAKEGQLLKMCYLETANCSNLVKVEKVDNVKIHDTKIDGDNLVVTYSKDFEGCAKLTVTEDQSANVDNKFCKKGKNIKEIIPLGDLRSRPELNINLCHKDKSNVCSGGSKITQKVDPPEIHSLKIDGDNLIITYSKELPTCTSFLTEENEEKLNDTSLVCKAGKNLEAIVPLGNIDAKVGEPLKMCYLNTTTCSKPVKVEKVEKINIKESKVEGDNLVVTYSKNFEGCANLTVTEDQNANFENKFCKQGENIREEIPLGDLKSFRELNINLCHKDKSNVCSKDLKVATNTAPPEVHSLKIEGNNVRITYSKSLDTCTSFLTKEDDDKLKDTSLACKAGKNLEAIVPLDKIEAKEGQPLKICYFNTANCSKLVEVEKEDIKINGTKIDEEGNLVVSYSKNFEGCAKLTITEDQNAAYENKFCGKGENIEEKIPLGGLIKEPEINISLCHKDNEKVCSSDEPLIVKNRFVHPELLGLKIEGNDLKITYSKVYSTCTTFLTKDNIEVLKDTSLACKAGDKLEVIVPLENIDAKAGQLLKMCYVGTEACSELIIVVGQHFDFTISDLKVISTKDGNVKVDYVLTNKSSNQKIIQYRINSYVDGIKKAEGEWQPSSQINPKGSTQSVSIPFENKDKIVGGIKLEIEINEKDNKLENNAASINVNIVSTACKGVGDSIQYGGVTYPTVKIGTQCWMGKNLNQGVMACADRVGETKCKTEFHRGNRKYCYDNKEENCTKYGGLYPYHVARAICPNGWHLPTKQEFEKLLSNTDIDKEPFNLVRGSGFLNALRNQNTFLSGPSKYKKGWSTYFWTSTDFSSGYAYKGWIIGSAGGGGWRNYKYGFPVRCISDEEQV